MNIEKIFKTIATLVSLKDLKAIENPINYIDGKYAAIVQKNLKTNGRMGAIVNGKNSVIAPKFVISIYNVDN